MKFCFILLCLFVYLLTSLPAEASSCYHYYDNEICILSIKRSAKYHWQYRVSVNVNNITYPLEVYNCRRKIKTQQNGQQIHFKVNGAGEFICKMVHRS